jgi:hypothetical protein
MHSIYRPRNREYMSIEQYFTTGLEPARLCRDMEKLTSTFNHFESTDGNFMKIDCPERGATSRDGGGCVSRKVTSSKPESAVLGKSRAAFFICSALAPVLTRSSFSAVQRAANTAAVPPRSALL